MFPIILCTNYKDILVTSFMLGPSMKRKPKLSDIIIEHVLITKGPIT